MGARTARGRPTAAAEPGDPPGVVPAVRLVVNANASGLARRGGRGAVLDAVRATGADVDLHVTSTLEDLAQLWGRDDGRRLVLAGGDGSLHAVANLPGPARDVALIPAGGANNIARSVGIPLELEAAARLAVEGSVHPLDLIEARAGERRRRVVESVSVGFLAQARARYHGDNSTDVPAALRASAGALARFCPLTVRVSDGEQTEDLHLAQVFVANLPLYEFGLRIAPHALPTDATMDVIGIEASTRRAVLRMILELRRGTHLSHSDVHLWRTPRLALRTDGCSPIVADSMNLGTGPVELRAEPAALRLVRP